MIIEKKLIGRFSEALQTAAFVPDQWMTALELLGRVTNSSHAEFVCWTRPKETPLKMISNLSASQSTLIRRWEKRVGDDPVVNPIISRAVRMPVLEVLTDEDVIGSSERERHVVWNEHYNKIDMPHMCFSPLWRSNDSVLGLFLMRSHRDGPVALEERKLFGQLAVRWQEAALTARVLKEEGARVLALALGGLSIPAILLDGLGRCTGLSLNAETLVSVGAILTVQSSRPRLANGVRASAKCAARGAPIRVDSDLKPCVDCVARSVTSLTSQPKACSIVLTGPSGVVARVRVSPFPRHHHEICFSAAAILIIELREAQCAFDLKADVVTMLTPAEQEIAARLVSGKRPSDIADAKGISIGTVRTHIKHMYSKVGVSSLVEFVARVRR